MRFAAFALVGACGFVVQMLALELLMRATAIGPLAATAVAVEIAVLHNFAWHERWTWRDRRRRRSEATLRRLWQFHLANGALSVGISLGCVALLTQLFGWPPIASNAIAVGITGLLNFLALDRWIFAAAIGLVILRPAPAAAQMQITEIDDPPRVAFYWEAGGTAGFAPNIDVLVAPHTSIRAGGLLYPFTDDGNVPWTALASLNQLFGRSGHYVEAGIGFVAAHRWWDDTSHVTHDAWFAALGYRLQKKRSFMRVGLTTPPPREHPPAWRPVAAISFGRTF